MNQQSLFILTALVDNSESIHLSVETQKEDWQMFLKDSGFVGLLVIALTVCRYSHSLLHRAKPLLHSLDALESFIPYFIAVGSIIIH